MLQQALERYLRDRGWDIESAGRVLTATREGTEVVLGFLQSGDVASFLGLGEEATAALGAVLLDPLPEPEVGALEEAGIVTFPRAEVEDLVVSGLLGRPPAGGEFLRFLEGD